MEQAQNPVFDQIQYFYVKCYFTVGVIALRHLPTLLNVDVEFNELPEALGKFLASVKKFFTQKVNFERKKAPVTLSTYEKAQERMLCKYLIRSFFL